MQSQETRSLLEQFRKLQQNPSLSPAELQAAANALIPLIYKSAPSLTPQQLRDTLMAQLQQGRAPQTPSYSQQQQHKKPKLTYTMPSSVRHATRNLLYANLLFRKHLRDLLSP